ncbi:peptidoglycan-binding protein [Rhizobium sp. HT1-10]|uniref:peptidoglycan-binding protein n=1 Tax=Rhizobium sp. HT1-10 TaxID=3111638 RepID=UPI003C2171C2
MNNLDRWNLAKFTRSEQIEAMSAKISANRARYDAVSIKTGVPWDVIAVIHSRESSCNFAGVLHNGEHIIGTGRKTTLVPKGRGPFGTWEDAAIDALMNCAPYAGKNTDWSLANTLDLLESYNGLGYRKKGLPSPYLWAGTGQYTSGKYVADGHFDPGVVDQQIGAAAILICLRGRAAVQPAATPQSAVTVLKVGSTGDAVKALQTALGVTADGSFGPATQSAVIAFQRKSNLGADGVAGPKTLAALQALR